MVILCLINQLSVLMSLAHQMKRPEKTFQSLSFLLLLPTTLLLMAAYVTLEMKRPARSLLLTGLFISKRYYLASLRFRKKAVARPSMKIIATNMPQMSSRWVIAPGTTDALLTDVKSVPW